MFQIIATLLLTAIVIGAVSRYVGGTIGNEICSCIDKLLTVSIYTGVVSVLIAIATGIVVI